LWAVDDIFFLKGTGMNNPVDRLKISFAPAQIADLHRRLSTVRWPEISFESGWSAGTNPTVLRALVEFWHRVFDWAKVQEELNQLDHFCRQIEGERIHWVSYSSSGTGKLFPIVLLHGWPGSFVEFRKAAPMLAKAGFNVIVPSLPGFVFSDAPRSPGMNPTRIAQRLHQLIISLGHTRYGVQGGDWGSPIGREMARLYPNHILGLHLNLSPWLPEAQRSEKEEETAYREARRKFDASETGYWSIQGTKPQSLCYALHDSPVGLLGWLLEKFYGWSDHGENLWETFQREEILTIATLYWLTGRIESAARIYYEARSWWPGDLSRVAVPTGYARFPKEPWGPPASFLEPFFNLVHSTEMPAGGHFAALEQPNLFADDVIAFFSKLA
jgi:pimeloyl-ACP methyl ester carboxylesterase